MKIRILISFFSAALLAVIFTPIFSGCSNSGKQNEQPAETSQTVMDTATAAVPDVQPTEAQLSETVAAPEKTAQATASETAVTQKSAPPKTEVKTSPKTTEVKKTETPPPPKPTTQKVPEKVVEKPKAEPTVTTPAKKEEPAPPKPIEPVVEKPKEPAKPAATETPKTEEVKTTQPAPPVKPAPQTSNWTVPESANNKANPVKADKSSLGMGKTLWQKHCASCHGKSGLGDGPKAAQLDTHAGDFTSAAFQRQTDGALFYKTDEGRDDMPGFKKKIPDDEDIWHLVNYMRSFK